MTRAGSEEQTGQTDRSGASRRIREVNGAPTAPLVAMGDGWVQHASEHRHGQLGLGDEEETNFAPVWIGISEAIKLWRARTPVPHPTMGVDALGECCADPQRTGVHGSQLGSPDEALLRIE